ncbi:MAG: sugar-binding transcriptional regulator [Solirubrobacterales bacterium]
MRDKNNQLNRGSFRRMAVALERFAPEALDLILTRYRILKEILDNQPVGRRQVANRAGTSERAARTEIDLLRERGAVEITPAGIVLTNFGMELIEDMDEIVRGMEGLYSLASRLKERFRLEHVIVTAGDAYRDSHARREMGRAAAMYLRSILIDNCVLAVTGGTTLAEMAQAMKPGLGASGITVLPARGGLGESMEAQANAIAARIAQTIGGNYRLLHVPDNLDEETIAHLTGNPQVHEILAKLKQADILVFGIGSASEMAARRGLPESALRVLEENQAVGEAFRYYFNQDGEPVYTLPGIGLELSDLKSIKRVVAVAGGSNKACAIEAMMKNLRRGILITDEGAARAILGGV